MVEKLYRVGEIETNISLYRLDYYIEDGYFTVSGLNRNIANIQKLLNMIINDKIIQDRQPAAYNDIINNLEYIISSMESKIPVFQQYEEFGEEFTIKEYGKTNYDICEEVYNIYKELLEILEQGLIIDGKQCYLCWLEQK